MLPICRILHLLSPGLRQRLSCRPSFEHRKRNVCPLDLEGAVVRVLLLLNGGLTAVRTFESPLGEQVDVFSLVVPASRAAPCPRA